MVRKTIGYAFARDAKRDPKLARELLEHPFFSHRTYAPKEKDVLRLSLIFVFGETEGSAYALACNYAVMLQHHFDADVPFEKVRKVLLKKGVEKSYREAVAARQKAKGTKRRAEAADEEVPVYDTPFEELGVEVPPKELAVAMGADYDDGLIMFFRRVSAEGQRKRFVAQVVTRAPVEGLAKLLGTLH